MKISQIILILTAYYIDSGFSQAAKYCSISVNGINEVKTPIILRNDSSNHIELIISQNGKILLSQTEIITLICPGVKNSLTATNSKISYAKCVKNDIFGVGNQNIEFDQIQCQKPIQGEVLVTARRCNNNKSTILNIGYNITSNIFTTLIQVCYDSREGNSFYSEHLLYGQDIKYSSKIQRRPSFSEQGLRSHVSAAIAYKRPFLKSTFNRLLGSSVLASKYINDNSYLARGHLSPDADFLYAAWQFTSYYYINTTPQWQVINGGNWKAVENLVRKTADYLKSTVRIITGTFGVLSLPNSRGKLVEIYLLSGRKLAVPKYIWKIVYFEALKQAIVLISLNNPFVGGTADDDLLCDSICNDYGWGSSSWIKYDRGLIFCCEYKQFLKIVNTAPKIDVVGILQGVN